MRDRLKGREKEKERKEKKETEGESGSGKWGSSREDPQFYFSLHRLASSPSFLLLLKRHNAHLDSVFPPKYLLSVDVHHRGSPFQ